MSYCDRLTGALLPDRNGRRGAHRYFADAKSREIVDLWTRIGREIDTVVATPEAKRLLRADVWSFANLGAVDGTKKRHGDVEREAQREAKRQARKAARSAMRRAGLCPISGQVVEQDPNATGRKTYVDANAQKLGQHIRRITALLPQITYCDKRQKNQWRAEFKALANLLNG